MMDKHFGQAKPLRSVYQNLHDIVAEAGYLSIGIRRSRDVFRFSLPYPGERWNLGQQQADNAAYAVYKASEVANKKADSAAEARWKDKKSRRKQQEDARSNAPAPGNRAEASIASALEQSGTVQGRVMGDQDTSQDIWHQSSRVTKVQIILWPSLQRFAAVGDPVIGLTDGENVSTILKSQVVYYYGRSDDKPEEGSENSLELDQWLQQRKNEPTWDLVLSQFWVVYVLGVLLLVVAAASYKPVADNLQHIVSSRSGRLGMW